MSNIKYAIVYLTLDPDYAKFNNLPVKLPILAQDFQKARETNKIPLEVIIRGLEAQTEVDKNNKYYISYLTYYYYEAFKKYLNQGDFDKAKSFLDKAAKINPDYRLYFYTGLYFKSLGNYELAELNLKQALKEKPNFAYGYFELGNLMFERGIYDEALENYMKSIEYEKDFSLSYLKIGDVYMENARYEEAASYYKKCIENDKEFIPAYERLGVVLNMMQRFKEAHIIHQKAIAIDDKTYEIYYNDAHSLAKLAEHNKAVEALEKALKIQETDYILHELALEYKNVGRYLEAVKTEERALEKADYENVDMIKLTLLKLSVIIEDSKRVSDYYNSLVNTKYYEPARNLKLLFDISQGDVKSVIKNLSENQILDFGSLLERLHNIDYYLNKLENFADPIITDSLLESINELGEIDPFILADNLNEKGIREEYVNWLTENTIFPKDVPLGIELITNSLLLCGFNYGLSERVSTILSKLLWKDGNGLAFGRLLLKFYQDRIFGEKLPLEDFIKENIEEIKDMSFYFAQIIANYEEFLMDFDSMLEFQIKNFEEALYVFLSMARLEITIEEINSETFLDEKVKTIALFVSFLNQL
ncbi:tetratricopeptide repeat protein [Petrotoga sp. 9PWA.NaAc.5.4]|uniref:tetratricopeptide repeat protein n=1 Tax=Petrotoga sp. 9PWA.NaAc.5.4 TaxID=1434328 RepID=UPI000CAC7E69|nr:tetratricopeptide repeat protein [Petrotoga sp. 9PWA.NaAc.5.4]PNR94742.1 hypothetical protein X924_05620 [Petrotoga sp. 9PWA.NaAc.5.4]